MSKKAANKSKEKIQVKWDDHKKWDWLLIRIKIIPAIKIIKLDPESMTTIIAQIFLLAALICSGFSIRLQSHTQHPELSLESLSDLSP